MQAAGGIDWMVAMAARVIESHPRQITVIAPLTAFAFCVGSGTGNIIYPLLPVIYDVSYKNHIRPARPLTLTVVQSGMALAASPVSAAMAAMLTLTEVAPYNLGLTQILAITLPACIVGIVVTALVVNRMWKDLDEDPEVQARIASGVLAPPAALAASVRAAPATPAMSGAPAGTSDTQQPVVPQSGTDMANLDTDVPPEPEPVATVGGDSAASRLSYTKEGRNSAIVFLLGVVAIVILGLFPNLRPAFEVEGEGAVPIDMTTTIVLVMFVVGTIILFVGRPDVKEVPSQSVFKAGMISAIALFGIAWLTATFIAAHQDYIVDTVGAWVTDWRFLFAIAVFIVAALTTSQSTATRTIVPIGLAAGLPAGIVTGMWAGALGGVYTLPANGTQIAAANFDLSGTTKLGSKLLDHSFFVPMLIMSVVTIVVGAVIGGLLF
jgi:anaerobic C4-dicarboxylate transporter